MTHNHDHSHDRDSAHSHGHSHSHDHDHSHAHGHGHGHAHGHGQKKSELGFEQKLEKLFSHWIDHNESHRQTFLTWAERAEEKGLGDVAARIEKAGILSGEITDNLKKAMDSL